MCTKLIVPVDSPDAPPPYDYSAGQVVEDQVHVLADSSELKPNESKTVEVDLSPAPIPLQRAGHYASGTVPQPSRPEDLPSGAEASVPRLKS